MAKDILDLYEEIQNICKKYEDIWVSSSSENYQNIHDWRFKNLSSFQILYESLSEMDFIKWCFFIKSNCDDFTEWIKTEKFPFIKNRPGQFTQYDTNQDKTKIKSLLVKIDNSITKTVADLMKTQSSGCI